MTVIELGEVSSEAPAPAGQRPIRPRDIRWIATAVLTVAVLLGVTGSAVPDPQGFRALWRISGGDQFTLADDMLFVHRTGPDPAIVAYSAEDGTPRWTYPMEATPGWLNTNVAGLLLVPAVTQQADGSTTVQDTLALDARTGRLRWRNRGEATTGDERGVLQLEWDPHGQLVRMHLVRPSDGKLLWTREPPGLTTTWTVAGADPARPDLVVTGTSGGRIEVRRIADGSLLRAATVPWPSVASLGEDSYAYLHTTTELLFAVRTEGNQQSLTAYDLRTLDRVWAMTGPATAGVFDCGRLVCVGGGTPDGVRALDPRTGATKWRSEGWDYARSLDATRMFAENRQSTNAGVIDAATGRMVTPFPPGMVVVDYTSGDLVLLAITKEIPTRLAVYELLGDNRLVLRGAMPQMSDQGCQLAQGRLACAIFEVGVPGISVSVMAVG